MNDDLFSVFHTGAPLPCFTGTKKQCLEVQLAWGIRANSVIRDFWSW